MYPLAIAKGEFMIREGEMGAHLYISAEGEFKAVANWPFSTIARVQHPHVYSPSLRRG